MAVIKTVDEIMREGMTYVLVPRPEIVNPTILVDEPPVKLRNSNNKKYHKASKGKRQMVKRSKRVNRKR